MAETRTRRTDTSAPRTEEDRVKARPERVPLHERNILTVKGKDPNKEYRWVTDKDDRLRRFLAAGYDFVIDHTLGVGEVTVNPTTQTGEVIVKRSGKTDQYLMAIDKDLYEEDQNAKEQKRLEFEKSMYRDLNSGKDGRYGGVERVKP